MTQHHNRQSRNPLNRTKIKARQKPAYTKRDRKLTNLTFATIAAMLILMLANGAQADDKVLKFKAGDLMPIGSDVVRSRSTGEMVKLASVNGVHWNDPSAAYAREALRGIVSKRAVTCVVRGWDRRNKRHVADCDAKGVGDVGSALVTKGYASHKGGKGKGGRGVGVGKVKLASPVTLGR